LTFPLGRDGSILQCPELIGIGEVALPAEQPLLQLMIAQGVLLRIVYYF